MFILEWVAGGEPMIHSVETEDMVIPTMLKMYRDVFPEETDTVLPLDYLLAYMCVSRPWTGCYCRHFKKEA